MNAVVLCRCRASSAVYSFIIYISCGPSLSVTSVSAGPLVSSKSVWSIRQISAHFYGFNS